MTGKVFLSCGQRPPEETTTAEKTSHLLADEFGLTTYVAKDIQSLDDIMTITKQLSSSDYFVFIDFFRRQKLSSRLFCWRTAPVNLPCSLFAHQELALARHLGFNEEVILLQQEGAPFEGFIRYIHSNPEKFSTNDEMLNALRRLVKQKNWKPDYSRNLVVSDLSSSMNCYTDHSGTSQQHIWHAKISNKRPDIAAIGTVCILDRFRDSSGQEFSCEDRAYLKWAGQLNGYETTILPEDFGVVDLCAVHINRSGLFLHSRRDSARDPIVEKEGMYELVYKIYAYNFPLLEFAVRVNLSLEPLENNKTTVEFV